MEKFFSRFVDEPLLRCAERFVAAYNRLTGKDNFSLARVIARVGFGGLFLFGVIYESWTVQQEGLRFSGLLADLLALLYFYFFWCLPLIRRAERARRKEQAMDMRWIATVQDLERERSRWLLVFVLLFLIRRTWVMSPATFVMICIAYVVSVDIPLQTRSAVADYLRNLRDQRKYGGVRAPVRTTS